jgi:hypothetical protein
MTWRRRFQHVLTVRSDTSDSRQSCQSKLSAQFPRPEHPKSNILICRRNKIYFNMMLESYLHLHWLAVDKFNGWDDRVEDDRWFTARVHDHRVQFAFDCHHAVFTLEHVNNIVHLHLVDHQILAPLLIFLQSKENFSNQANPNLK